MKDLSWIRKSRELTASRHEPCEAPTRTHRVAIYQKMDNNTLLDLFPTSFISTYDDDHGWHDLVLTLTPSNDDNVSLAPRPSPRRARWPASTDKASPAPAATTNTTRFLNGRLLRPNICASPAPAVDHRPCTNCPLLSRKVPLIAIVLVIAIMIFLAFYKRRMRANAGTATHELTAAQLTRTNPAPTSRRTRRTPSQISTRSLPPYMKNPGDLEMVLDR